MISLNLTVHNKSFLLPEVLSGIKNNTTGNYEIIFVLDGCTDSSLQMVEYFCMNNPRIKTKILEAPDVYETKANNLALKNSTGNYAIIIQDDQIITQSGYNERLLKPFHLFSDVFAVTGRCAHSWRINPHSIDINKDEIDGYAWSDILEHYNHADKSNTDRDTFAIRNSVNRGPLVVDLQAMESIGYFDESYKMDMDEHNACYLAKEKLGMVSGFYDIGWTSEARFGGTRDEDGNTKQWALKNNHISSKIFYNRWKEELIKPGIVENRNCK